MQGDCGAVKGPVGVVCGVWCVAGTTNCIEFNSNIPSQDSALLVALQTRGDHNLAAGRFHTSLAKFRSLQNWGLRLIKTSVK